MLNLTDKDLDRLAREAAQEYDPGGLTNAASWNKVQAGLDRELGRVRFNPFRAIRRTPFLYAPVALLLVGVSYYFISHSRSGSPPRFAARSATVQPATTPKQSDNAKIPTYKPTSTPAEQKENVTEPASGHSTARAAGADLPAPGNGTSANAGSPSNAVAVPHNGSEDHHANHLSGITHNAGRPGTHNPEARQSTTAGAGHHSTRDAGLRQNNTASAGHQGVPTNTASPEATPGPTVTRSVTEAAYSMISASLIHAATPKIDDSKLRAGIRTTGMNQPGPITLSKPQHSHYINRSLQIGAMVAPDFASVKELAGDRPGVTMGLTLDYQFVNKLHLGTGLLFSRKNYTATAEDYHVPYDYYRVNGMHNVDYVKGSFAMLEIPLNLRYDFSVTGNTLFYASAGLSSYLLARENCNYYFNLFGREVYRGFNYKDKTAQLFSAVDLSIGVETALSNDLSLMIAPYVKVPTGGLGFGGVNISSTGVQFGVKYAPVLSRKRR